MNRMYLPDYFHVFSNSLRPVVTTSAAMLIFLSNYKCNEPTKQNLRTCVHVLPVWINTWSVLFFLVMVLNLWICYCFRNLCFYAIEFFFFFVYCNSAMQEGNKSIYSNFIAQKKRHLESYFSGWASVCLGMSWRVSLWEHILAILCLYFTSGARL